MGNAADAFANVVLEHGPGGLQGVQSGAAVGEERAGRCESGLTEEVAVRCARSDELIGQAGEQLLHQFLAPRQERVDVAALGHPAAVVGGAGEGVALDDRDPFVHLAQCARREQTRHARPHHYGPVPDRGHRRHLLVRLPRRCAGRLIMVQVERCSLPAHR